MTKRTRVTLSLLAVHTFCEEKGLLIKDFKDRLVDKGIPLNGLDQWLYKKQEPPIPLIMALLEVWPKDDPFNLIEVHNAHRAE